MSKSEKLRPDLISASNPSPGTDRGETSVANRQEPEGSIDRVMEPPNASSMVGLQGYMTDPVEEPADKLRSRMQLSILLLIGVLVLGPLGVHILLAVQTGTTDSLDKYTSSILNQFAIPAAMLILGYLFGQGKLFDKRKR